MKKMCLVAVFLLILLSGSASASELNFKGKTFPIEGQRSLGNWGICTLDQPMLITPGMELVYEICVDKNSVWGQGGVDLTGGTVNNLRDNGKIVDGDNKTVRGWANERGVWLERRFKLDPAAGKTFANVIFICGEIDKKEAGIYNASIRNLRVEAPGQNPVAFEMSDRRVPDTFRNFEKNADAVTDASGVLSFNGAVLKADDATVRSWGYWGIAGMSEPVMIEPGSELVYEYFVVPGSVSSAGGVDLTGGTVNNLRDNKAIVDQNGRDVRNVGNNPDGQWLERRFKLGPAADKTFIKVDFFSSEMEKAPSGSYQVKIRNLRIETPGKAPLMIVPNDQKIPDKFSNMADPVALQTPAGVLEPGSLRLASQSPVGNVNDFVSVIITPPGWGFTLPDKAYLSYEVKLLPDSVNSFAGINLMFDGRDLRYRYNRENEIITDVSAYRGKWGTRKIDLARLANCRIYEAYAVAGFHQMAPGKVGAEFRNIRIEDAGGKTLCNLSPGKDTLLNYPLLCSVNYVTDVNLTIPDAVGCRFRPSKYLADDQTALTGKLYLHNFDPVKKQTLDYRLQLGGKIIAQAQMELAPDATQEIPVELGKLAAGDYIPQLTVNGKTMKDFAISVRSNDELKNRKRAWQDGASAVGIVPMTAPGAGGVWNIPAMRELGGNYYQCRINWALLETAPGKYDFSKILPYLEMARDCGVDVQIDFYSGYPAYSVPEFYRQYEMLLNDGNRHGGAFSPIAYWSPGFAAGLEAMKQFYAGAAKDPTVLAFNAWIGGNMDSYYGLLGGRERKNIMDYSPWALEQYRHYVKNILKYSLDDANRLYGLNLKDWSELALPQPRRGELDLRPYWQDFMRYRSWSVNEMQNKSSQVVRQLSSDAEIEYLYGGGLLAARQGNDYNQALLNAVKHNGSIHHTAAPGAVDLMYLGALTRNFNVPFSIETAGTPAAMPEHQWAMYELLREGAAGFTWISSPGLTYRPPASYGMGEYRQSFDRLRNARPLGPSIALIAGTSQQKTDIFNENTEVKTAMQQLRELATHLEAAGYDVDVFTDETSGVDWKKYQLVIDPGSVVLTAECADGLAQFVRQGGKLLMFANSGKYTAGAPDERWRLLNLVKDPGKGAVKVLSARPGVKKSANADFRQLANRYHNGVYPSELDAVIAAFAGITPRALTGEDNIYLSLRQDKDRYFVILFNNSDRLREFRYLPGIPAGDYYVYDLVRRQSRQLNHFYGQTAAQLMPYEIIVEEWSKKPVTPPLYDAPLPRRCYVAPDKSYYGYQLANRLTPAGTLESHPDFTVLTVSAAPGSALRLPIPGTGSYELNLALIDCPLDRIKIKVNNDKTYELKEINRRAGFAIYSNQNLPLKLAPGDFLTLETDNAVKIVYLELNPDFVPLARLTVTPGRVNPGAYNGPAFQAPLPSYEAVAGRTLAGVKGFFDLSVLGVNGAGVAEIAWEVNSPEAQPGLLAVSADFGLRLKLNDEEIFDSSPMSRQAPFAREFLVPVQLKKGVNQFVGRVTSGSDGWRFWCEMMRL